MQVSVSDAKARLTDLVRRAEAGADVVLTRHGQPAVRLVAVETRRPATQEEVRRCLETLRGSASRATPGPSAARSADFLYDADGLPA